MQSVSEKIRNGDVIAVARLIRDIDEDVPNVREILNEIYPFTGKAYVIGITGAPGVGKSTLIDQMVSHLRKRDKTVGVLAIDPTSPFSGGAIMGDRVRMQRHSTDDGVFIRSLATRGHFGGLSQSTRSAISVLDAMGKDYIIVETVGVGQDEVDVVNSSHTTVVVVIPGMGDGIQAIKAGILEVGDIFVVNKEDREGAEKTVQDLEFMIDMNHRKNKESNWRPQVLRAQAIHDKGVEGILEKIDEHRSYIFDTLGEIKFRKKMVREELVQLVKNRLVENVIKKLIKTDEFDKTVDLIVNRKMDPYTACEKLALSNIFYSNGKIVKDLNH